MSGLDAGVDVPEARKVVDEALERVRKTHPESRGMVLKGDVAELILERAHISEAKLVVVGHKGVEKVGVFSLGDVADAIARRSKRPVLVVKSRGRRHED